MKIYISGPMTGLPEYNYLAFHAAQQQLESAGHEVIQPARGMVAGWVWADYMRRALRDLCDAEAVATLPGLGGSRGACLEVDIAGALGLRVASLEVYL